MTGHAGKWARRLDLRAATVLGLATLLAACDGPPPGAAGVDAGAGALWGDSLVLVEELRLGALDGPEAQTFGRVAALAPAPDGSFYVADAQVPVVRRFDAQGRHLGNVGREGEGPGEYLSLDGLAVDPEGRLAVWDGRLRRLSRFDADGALLGATSHPEAVGGFRGFVWGVDGSMLVRSMPSAGLVSPSEGSGFEWSRMAFEEALEPLHTAPPEESVGPRYVLAGLGGYYRPFVTMTLSTGAPDGTFYVARNDEYRIRRITATGDTLEPITRAQAPIQVTPQERAEWEARSERFAERVPEQRDDFFPIPRVKPFIRELVVDPQGRLWVSRYTEPVFMEYSPEERERREREGLPSYQWRDTLTWDVWAPDGTLLGVVTLPLRTTLSTALDDHVWGIQAGPLEEPHVVRWRVEAVSP